jgi:hypothetical protein
VLFAAADLDAGTQGVLLEDLSACVQLGLFFGGGSPLNWGKDLPALTAAFPALSVAKVLRPFGFCTLVSGRLAVRPCLCGSFAFQVDLLQLPPHSNMNKIKIACKRA